MEQGRQEAKKEEIRRVVCIRSKADLQNDEAGGKVLNRRTLAGLTEA